MTDRFANSVHSLEGPGIHAFEVTPSDSSELSEISRAIYCGTGGSLSVTLLSGAAVIFRSVPDGTVLPLRVKKIAQTGTTATDIVAIS